MQAELSHGAGLRDVLDPTRIGAGQGVGGGAAATTDTEEHEDEQGEGDQRLPVKRGVEV